MGASLRAVAFLIVIVIVTVSIVMIDRGEKHSLSAIKKELGRDTN